MNMPPNGQVFRALANGTLLRTTKIRETKLLCRLTLVDFSYAMRGTYLKHSSARSKRGRDTRTRCQIMIQRMRAC